ncbi:MAG: LamG domain-containing protein, partial [Candidatus Pacebacteria bacterium]|nr:LamG domain-containing protein [Candidatus Paceibacterota bacterium]
DGGDSIASFEIGTNLKLTPSAVQEYKRDSSLIGYWTFDEGSGSTVYDSSGNGYNGAWESTIAYSTGKVGPYAGSFPGTNGVDVSVSSSAFLSLTSNITVSGWIKPVVIAGCASTIIGWGYDYTNGKGYLFYLDSAYYSTSLRLNGAGGLVVKSDPSSISDNVWVYVTATYDGHFGKVYINGLQQNIGSYSTAISNTSTTPSIGGVNGGGRYQGLIDDLRVYNRVLSAAEILALYDGTK